MTTTKKRSRVQELESHVLNLGRGMSKLPGKIHAMLKDQTDEITRHFDSKVRILNSQQQSLEKRVRAIEGREDVRDGVSAPGNGAS